MLLVNGHSNIYSKKFLDVLLFKAAFGLIAGLEMLPNIAVVIKL